MTRIVQISDIHYGYSKFMEDILLRTIDEINEMQPDIVILSGDLTNHGFHREFVEVKKYLDLIEPPMVIIPGNHDARNTGEDSFEELFGDRYGVYELKDQAIKIIALDSTEPDENDGKVGRLQTKFLEEEIKDANDRGLFIIIVLHHHIISVPNTGRERNILSDAGDVLVRLVENDVNLVLSGHKHVPFAWKIHKTMFVTAGTVSSLKLRGNTNPSYNVIEIENQYIDITLHESNGRISQLKPPY